MRVMLIADPPAGDKAERELRKIPEVELTYMRNRLKNGCPEIPQGTRFVLLMNGGPWVGKMKEEAHKVGATVLQISPSWSSTVMELGRWHFYDSLKQEAAPQDNDKALTYKPFKALSVKVAEPEERKEEGEGKAMAEVDVKKYIPPLYDAAARALKGPAIEDAKAFLAADKTLLDLTGSEAHRRYLVQQQTGGRETIGQTPFRKYHKQAILAAAREEKRAERAAKKMQDTGVAELPKTVVEAQAEFVKVLRDYMNVKEYTLTYVDGEAESTFEMEVRQVAKGKAKL